MRRRRTSPVLLLAVLVTAACGSSSSGTSGSAPQAASGGSAAPSAAAEADASGMASFDMATRNYVFVPSVLHGTPGQRLTIHLTNSSGTAHNFTLKDQKVNTDIASGVSKTVTITFPASGQLVFTCEYHAARGMAGALVAGAGAASPAPSSAGGGVYNY